MLVSAAARHDVFILSSHTWIHRHLDLALLKLLRKRIIWVFTGTDHRPPYLDGSSGAHAVRLDARNLVRVTRKVRYRVMMAERYADEIVALPASAHLHSRPIIDFLRIGIPFAIPEDAAKGAPSPFRGEGVRVLHAPSNRVGKGSDVVWAAITELRAAGHAIDYHELHGRPHHEVLTALRHCDFVVDEVFSDTPMATFVAEAAAFGKPAVVTGYYAELVADQLPPEAIPPSLFEPPERLVAAIERMATDEVFRRDLGERARAFVLENWTPAAVARRYLRIIEGDVPPDWRWDPARQRYLYGWGMNRHAVARTVHGLTSFGGRTELGLAHNPELEVRMLEMASRLGGSDSTGSN